MGRDFYSQILYCLCMDSKDKQIEDLKALVAKLLKRPSRPSSQGQLHLAC